MKLGEEVLRFGAADDAIVEAVEALKEACQKRGVRAQVALIALVTTDGLLCRTAYSAGFCRGKEPDVDPLHSEVGEVMKKFVEKISGATIVESDIGGEGPKS